MPATLFTYMQGVQRLVRDQRQQEIDPEDLIYYINFARREVAMRSQCIRILTPISGSVLTASVVNPGVNYSSLSSVSITPPDFPSGTLPYPSGAQASAAAVIVGGQLQSVEIPFGGAGYFQPVCTVSDPTNSGSNASVVLQISPINTLNQGQEVYPFSAVDLSPFPGVASIYMVRSISPIFSNWRYSLPVYSMSVYQARVRNFAAGTYQYIPAVAAQFGRGANGSLFCYPIPSTTYQVEWDASALPSDLVNNLSFEAIPDPWCDAVQFMAAHMAFLELQNANSARAMLDLFELRMKNYSQHSQPGRRTSPYGRWAIWFTLLPALASALGWA